jgi:hypothetical protein
MEPLSKAAAGKRPALGEGSTATVPEPLPEPYQSHAIVLEAGEKGLGLFAASDIERSQTIVCEPATLCCISSEELQHMRGNGVVGKNLSYERLNVIIELMSDTMKAHERYFGMAVGAVPSSSEASKILSRPINRRWLPDDCMQGLLQRRKLTDSEMRAALTLAGIAGGSTGVCSQATDAVEIPFNDLERIDDDLKKINYNTEKAIRDLRRIDQVQRFVADAHATWEASDVDTAYMSRYSYMSSIVNHACIPNALLLSRHIDGNLVRHLHDHCTRDSRPLEVPLGPPVHTKCSLIALRPIRKGEEITISYMPLRMAYLTYGREDRRQYLNWLFGFECQCFECVDEDRQNSIYWETAPKYTKIFATVKVESIGPSFWKTVSEHLALSAVGGTATLSLLFTLRWVTKHHSDDLRSFLIWRTIVERLIEYLGRNHPFTTMAHRPLRLCYEGSELVQRYCESDDQGFFPDELSVDYLDSRRAFFCQDASPDDTDYLILHWDPEHGVRNLTAKQFKKYEDKRKKRQRQRKNAKEQNESIATEKEKDTQQTNEEPVCDEQNLSKSQKRNRKQKMQAMEAAKSGPSLPLRPRQDSAICIEPEIIGSIAAPEESTTVESNKHQDSCAESPPEIQTPATSSLSEGSGASDRVLDNADGPTADQETPMVQPLPENDTIETVTVGRTRSPSPGPAIGVS